MKSKLYYTLVLLYGCIATVNAQNNTSPYSILGIGEIESSYYGRWSGMANASMALSSNRYQNEANPASLPALDNQFFNFEISGRYKYTSYSKSDGSLLNIHSADISMTRLGIAMKILPKWGSGVGLMPFSTSNYSFYSTKNIQGTNSYQSVYNQGTGGVNRFYWSNGYQLNKNFSVGIQTSFLFGSLNRTETLSSDVTGSSIVTTTNTYLRKPSLTYGFQYKGKVSKKWQVAMGATYAPKVNLNAEYSLKVTEDAVDLVDEDVLENDSYTVPGTYTAGLALIKNNNFTIAADYKRQDWSTLNYKGFNYALVNSNRISAGFEYAKKTTDWNTTFEHYFYQGGLVYNESYLQLYNQELKEYGLTLGFGANSKRNALGYHVALEVGQRGTLEKGLIKETYSKITFTLLYRDFWFTKGRKYD